MLWLVPEPRSRWGTADSALPAYLESVDLVVEATDLDGLAPDSASSCGGCDVTIRAPGTVVAWWEHDAIAFGVVVTEEKQRVVLVTADGREAGRARARRGLARVRSGAGPYPEGRREAAAAALGDGGGGRRSLRRGRRRDAVGSHQGRGGDDRRGDAGQPGSRERGRAACLATALALARDGVRFVRKASGWQPRGEEAVAEIVTERDNVARRAEEKADVFAALRRAWREGVFRRRGTSVERRVLTALEALAVLDLEAPEKERALALEALQAAGARGTARPRRPSGCCAAPAASSSDDENLAIVRFGLRTAFAEETVLAAEAAARAGFDRSERRDLTGRVSS